MGAIWAARLRTMRDFERMFAIKLILPQLADEQQMRQMLVDEARIAAGISHPNVAQVTDVGEHAAGVYLVMEWIDGDSVQLLQRSVAAKGERIPLGIALRIVSDACAGLHAAHELRDRNGELLEVVHRDVSPQNILVATSGAVKLIDFGVAKARGRAQDETSLGVVKGKLRYMAPEQFLPERGTVIDRRADIWSMGAVLRYLVTGQQLLPDDNEAATAFALFSGKPFEPLPDWVPEPVRQIIARALMRERSERFPTAQAMMEAIEAAASDLGLRCSSTALAEYYGLHMSDCIDARRQALHLGATTAERLAVASGPRLSHEEDQSSIRRQATSQPTTADRSGAIDDTRQQLQAMKRQRRLGVAQAASLLLGGALVMLAIVGAPRLLLRKKAPATAATSVAAPGPLPATPVALPSLSPLPAPVELETPAASAFATASATPVTTSARPATARPPRPPTAVPVHTPARNRPESSNPELSAIDSRK
jgi:serine/threonine-protein kinase